MIISVDLNDKRWGGYIPWFLRHGDFIGIGNYLLFFERVSHRSFQLLYYNEPEVGNLMHFGSIMESKTLQVFKYEFKNEYGIHSLAYGLKEYFHPKSIKTEMEPAFYNDPVQVKLRRFRELIKMHHAGGMRLVLDDKNKALQTEYEQMEKEAEATRPQREAIYCRPLVINRLGVLEVLLKMLPTKTSWVADYAQDVRRYIAEAGLSIDIDMESYSIVLLDEKLFNKEIIDNLLPRLYSRYKERGIELVRCYHDMLTGKDFDDIFISAFKTLEELGRSITNDPKFDFSPQNLNRHFPEIHKTIATTIIKLDAHRGDKAGHGKSKPGPHEMRYLLLSICNIALLLLDCKNIK